MLQSYFRALYQDAIGRAYELAFDRIAASLTPEARVLDCGASSGTALKHLEARVRFSRDQYSGLEWSAECVARGQAQGLDIRQGDLNRGLPYADASYSCIYGLSLLEHLLNPCRFLKDCHRVLRPGGELVLLTPNISTYFTAVLILMGKMPSSGPHPDSDLLIKREEIFKVSPDE
ncbi:MAG TPA: class I SAM-dependent methyltransferase, partial [Solimonas sp.]|nr:class I SAM-dependent methyltransferase [Solimonas sp.]